MEIGIEMSARLAGFVVRRRRRRSRAREFSPLGGAFSAERARSQNAASGTELASGIILPSAVWLRRLSKLCADDDDDFRQKVWRQSLRRQSNSK